MDGGSPAATAVVIQSDMDLAIKEGADGQDHRFGAEFQSHLGNGSDNPIVFNNQILNRLLEDHQVGLFQRSAYRLTMRTRSA